MAPVSSAATAIGVALSAWLWTEIASQTADPACKSFQQIYSSGQGMCDEMFGTAFKYETDESKAYTMWFFSEQNPNDAIAQSLGKLSGAHDTCFLEYFHKSAPGPESDEFTECHPWKDNACCAQGTVETYTKLKESYGPEYHWDRCGPLSQACERFFVQEACLYECDPNAGLYRKYNSSVYDPRCDKYAAEYDADHASVNNCAHNTWEMHQMPIQASYCNAWFDACRNDMFCAHDDGDFFSCAAVYKQVDVEAEAAKAELNATLVVVDTLKKENDDLKASLGDEGLSTAALVGIILPSVAAAAGLCLSCWLIKREKDGQPMFGRLMDDGPRGSPQEYGKNGV